ncbi:hypothetical protein QJS10_CPB19g00769 [Acorus calamus]|uniref:Uncharacterized protein n=1 Tax=Acorus calamus TaxID=4465 RepID=A0AAV9CIL3_ACOCL|nr:hypothetical protein QJS10_CPB19g00769 [Acorus calamus]
MSHFSSFRTPKTEKKKTNKNMAQMEGLIPYIYRAMKKKRRRRYYKCLSMGPAARAYETQFLMGPTDNSGHRRHRSMEEFSGGFYSPEQNMGTTTPRLSKEGVGFRSFRVLACIGKP